MNWGHMVWGQGFGCSLMSISRLHPNPRPSYLLECPPLPLFWPFPPSPVPRKVPVLAKLSQCRSSLLLARSDEFLCRCKGLRWHSVLCAASFRTVFGQCNTHALPRGHSWIEPSVFQGVNYAHPQLCVSFCVAFLLLPLNQVIYIDVEQHGAQDRAPWYPDSFPGISHLIALVGSSCSISFESI